MKKLKNAVTIFLSVLTAFTSLVIAPVSAGAVYYPAWPTEEEIEEARKALPVPNNLRVDHTTADSVNVKWDYEGYGYNIVYTTDPDADPPWDGDTYTVVQKQIDEYDVTVDNLSPDETYYIYVRHATISNISMHLVFLGGDYKRLVVKKQTVTAKTKSASVSASALKSGKKTVKPLTLSKVKGKAAVKLVKKGTTAAIYKKLSVNKKNGAVTLKKGNYKKKTYNVKLKITADGGTKYMGKTITKTVKIRVK